MTAKQCHIDCNRRLELLTAKITLKHIYKHHDAKPSVRLLSYTLTVTKSFSFQKLTAAQYKHKMKYRQNKTEKKITN